MGKYSAECKTKAAVEILHQQFKKFITPAVPQQEERIQEISDLAQRLYGDVSFKILIGSPLNTFPVNLADSRAWQTRRVLTTPAYSGKRFKIRAKVNNKE